MSYKYKSEDGLCQSDNVRWINIWNNIVLEQKNNKENWIVKLRSEGVKAAHPDDGWIDRRENSVYFLYPQFNDGVNIGDTIALGNADKWRLVRVIDVKYGMLSKNPIYYFE